jgi:hypothetical protein
MTQRVPLEKALPAILEGHRQEDPAAAVFAAVDTCLATSPGHRLLTVLMFVPERSESVRVYSSHPGAHPVGGRKSLTDAPRMQQVLASGVPFVGHSRQAIVDNFPDHQKLLAHGWESIINMPVHWGRRVLGTVNLMHAEGHYAGADLRWVQTCAQLCVPAFLERGSRR